LALSKYVPIEVIETNEKEKGIQGNDITIIIVVITPIYNGVMRIQMFPI
jgi:hypothetical protein